MPGQRTLLLALVSCLAIVTGRVHSWATTPSAMTTLRWRYDVTVANDPSDGFLTQVHVHVLNVSHPQWELHPSSLVFCALLNGTLPSARIDCRYPIDLVVQVKNEQGLSDQFSIQLGNYPGKLSWNVATDVELLPNSTNGSLLIWLSESSDSVAMATTRSAKSTSITNQLYRVGESPMVTFTTSAIIPYGQLSFNVDEGCWVLPIQTIGAEQTSAKIQGRGIAFLTLQAPDATIPVAYHKYSPSWPRSTDLPSTPPGHVRRDACMRSVMAVPFSGDNRILFSQDAFATSQILSVPLDSNNFVEDVAFTQISMVILTKTSVMFSTELNALSTSTGIPSGSGFGIRRIQSSGACDRLLNADRSPSPYNAMVAAWSSSALFVSVDGGASFTDRALPMANLTILNVVFEHRHTLSLALLAQHDGVTTLFQFDDGQWVSSGAVSSEFTSLEHAGFGSSDVTAFGRGGVLYSDNGGAFFTKVRLLGRSATMTEGLMDNEAVLQVATFPGSTSWAAFTTRNRIFFGAFPYLEAIEIQSGEPVSSLSSEHRFVVLGGDGPPFPSLAMLVIGNGTVSVRTVPVSDELLGVRASCDARAPLSCPFSMIPPADSTFYLDLGENVTIESDMILFSKSWQSSISLSVDDSHLLRVDSTTNSTVQANGITLVANTATIQESNAVYANASTRLAQATGSTSFRVVPVDGNPSCFSGAQLYRVRVGCPPGRRVAVRDYNGSPIRVFHQTAGFRPAIDIYDDDAFVKEALGDYVVDEVSGRGRKDHTYVMNAAQAGCLRRPQSWDQLDGRDWTPLNNVDCFRTSSSVQSRWDSWQSQPYEVLNATGKNFIKFQAQAADGLFVFNITFVDPNYTYCQLSTTMVLDVYGRPLDAATTWIMISVLSFIVVTTFFGSYFWYRREMLLSKKES